MRPGRTVRNTDGICEKPNNEQCAYNYFILRTTRLVGSPRQDRCPFDPTCLFEFPYERCALDRLGKVTM